MDNNSYAIQPNLQWPTQPQPYNGYPLNNGINKWNTNNQSRSSSQSSTPTNPTMHAAFPSFATANAGLAGPSTNTIAGGNTGMPSLLPSVSAASNSSLPGAGTATNAPSNTPSFLGTTIPTMPYNGNSFNNTQHMAGNNANHMNRGPYSMSASSSTSSLNALTGQIGKLSINTQYTNYPQPPPNTYTPVFTPTGPNGSNLTTPQGQNTTGFRFTANYTNPHGQVNTQLGVNGMNNMNNMHTSAQFPNHINAMGMNINAMGMGMNNNMRIINNNTLNNINAMSGGGGGQQPLPPNEKPMTEMRMSRDAKPYHPQMKSNVNEQINVGPSQSLLAQNVQTNETVNGTISNKETQLSDNNEIAYSYSSYADAVHTKNKVSANNNNNNNNTLPPMNPIANLKKRSEETLTPSQQVKENGVANASRQKLNPPTWPKNPKNGKFYVIKSFGEDDVHKSIKYNLWCSTERGNRKLDEAFNDSKRMCGWNDSKKDGGGGIDPRDTINGCPVYLFFSVNRSGCFCGMAQMISNYYKDRNFGSWVQDGKWQGSFIVKWIYVKDIPNKDLKDIILENNDNRPVTFSRDTQEIPYKQGVQMLERFIAYSPKTNILQDFKYYDDRENDIKVKRTQQQTMMMNNVNNGNPNNDGNPHGMVGPSSNMNMIKKPINPSQQQTQYNPYNNNNNKFYSNKQSNQVEGYNSYRGRPGGYNNMARNNNQNRSYNDNNGRRYYSKNIRNNKPYHNNNQNNQNPNNRDNRNGGNMSNGSNGSNNMGNGSNNKSQYGDLQILQRKSNPNVIHTADQNVNEKGNVNDENNADKRRYLNNNTRSRWVPK